MTTVHDEVWSVSRPCPPFDTGSERNEGTQEKRPHQAKRLAAFMPVIKSVRRASLPRKSSLAETFGACVQVSGSFTLLRIHTATRAGRSPTRKTALQPKCGMTRATTTAATGYPIDHALCTTAK